MGVLADNAAEMMESVEAMAFDARQSALDSAAWLAERVPGALRIRAEVLAEAEGRDALQAGYEALRREMSRALEIARSDILQHGEKGGTDAGNLRIAYSKMIEYAARVGTIHKMLLSADRHDLMLIDLRAMEKGLREAGL
jgi:hypothetical protein